MALTALHILGRAWLWAVARAVAVLLAVAAGILVNTLLLAIARTMTDLRTDHALDLRTASRLLTFLLTKAASVTQF